MTWAAAEKARLDSGAIRESAILKLFFRKAIELRPDLDNYLFFANEMIKVSRIFEEGKITREQFDDKKRQLAVLLNQEDRRRTAVLAREQALIFFEKELFFCYRESLFRDYANDLRRQLTQAGPQYSNRDCAVFGDSIQHESALSLISQVFLLLITGCNDLQKIENATFLYFFACIKRCRLFMENAEIGDKISI